MPPFGMGHKPVCHDVGENNIGTFTDVKPARTFLPIKCVLTWGRLTVNLLGTTVMLTVYCLHKW